MKKQMQKSVATFSRWMRKPYAAFASIGRAVRIGVLSTTMLIVTFDAMAAAADTTRLVRVEAVAVSAERAGASAGALDVPRVAADELTVKFAPISSIEAAIRTLPFADVRQRGARGTQADISLRGGNADQSSILLNGVNFSDARTGHQSHSLPIPLSAISSVNYLSHHIAVGSYTGALDYRVGQASNNFFNAALSGGMYGTYSIEASGTYNTKGGLSIFGAASYDRSDGYIQNTDLNRLNLYSRAVYRGKAGTFDFQIGYQTMDFGSNGFYSLAYPDQWEATQTALTSLCYSKRWGKWSVDANVSYRLNTDRFELYRPGYTTPPASYKGGNYHLTDNAAAAASVSYAWGAAGTTSIGIDFAYNHIWSTVLGEKTERPLRVNGITYNFAKDRTSASYWLRHAVTLGRFDLTGVISLADNSYTSDPLGGLSVGYRIVDGLRIEGAVARTMRLPTFTDLYYTTPTHIGNKNLVPERATTYSLSLSYERGDWSAVASSYFRDGSNVIDWVQLPSDMVWKSQQITSLGTFGVELAGSYHPSRGFVQLITLSYGYINADKQSGEYISKYALDYMRHKVAIATQFRLHRKLILAINGTFYDRNGQYQISANEPAQEFKPYFLLDARLTWNVGKFSLWAECTNILDTHYFDFGGIIQPGTWAMAGVSVRL